MSNTRASTASTSKSNVASTMRRSTSRSPRPSMPSFRLRRPSEMATVVLLAAFGAANYEWQNGATGNNAQNMFARRLLGHEHRAGLHLHGRHSGHGGAPAGVRPGPRPYLCEGETVVLEPNVAEFWTTSCSTKVMRNVFADRHGGRVLHGGCGLRWMAMTRSRWNSVRFRCLTCPRFRAVPGRCAAHRNRSRGMLVTWSTGEVGASGMT